MSETIPADFIDKPQTGYIFVALLSDNARRQIGGLLSRLDHELPGVIWPMPPRTLHVTLYEIIQSRKKYSHDKDALYTSHRTAYEQGILPIFSKLEPFSISFDTIEASEHAIIVRATDNGQFASTRAEITEQIPIPSETKRPPEIIHSSIARYTEAVDLEHVRSVLGGHAINFEEPITEFKLLKTLVPPLLEYEEIANFPLKG